eukprot:3734522-Amphidinium_carterae.1
MQHLTDGVLQDANKQEGRQDWEAESPSPSHGVHEAHAFNGTGEPWRCDMCPAHVVSSDRATKHVALIVQENQTACKHHLWQLNSHR